MVDMYPLCAFRKSTVAASIDTPCTDFCRTLTSTICIGLGIAGACERPEKMESSIDYLITTWFGCLGSVRASSWP